MRARGVAARIGTGGRRRVVTPCGLTAFRRLTAACGVASARRRPPPAAPPAADPPYVASSYVTPTDVSPSRVPATRIGFQMAIRTGYSVPFGKAFDGPKGDMSDNFSGQVPIFVEVGGKPIANLFVGGYFGLNIGGVAGATQKTCDTLRATCVAVGVRIGAEIQYHFLPDRAVNPWIGYGIGYEVAAQGISAPGHDETDSLTGFEFARLSSGSTSE